MTDDLPDEDKPLIPVAARIAEGQTIDWALERERAPEADAAMFDALQEIADIESAHRGAQQAFPAEADPTPTRWRHLSILEEIGTGHFGTVNRAFDNTLQIEVALKLSPLNRSGSFDDSRTLREARQLAKVHHPNVVRVYGADYCDGRAGIWMDLVKGRTLEQMLEDQRFSAAEAANVGIQLCRALAAVHREGLLHGDIKPHNVVRRENGDLVLVDFGASAPLVNESAVQDELVGTLVYMAPEVLRGEPRSRASDIYALGVLLFRLVTDTYPVFATSVDGALQAHKEGRRQLLRDLRPELPGPFVETVERAMAAAPEDRYTSAAALETALLERSSALRAARRGTAWRNLAIVAIIAALGLGAWAVLASNTPRTPGSSFRIDASFYRATKSGAERLDATKTFRVDDEFYLSARVSAPTHIYVVDEDDAGRAFLLFPLPGNAQTNPVPPDQTVKVPADVNWSVDSPGGREHLLVFASPTPLSAFEDAFKRLPAPALGTSPAAEQPLPDNVLEQFRGVGRLKQAPPAAQPSAHPSFWQTFEEPLNGPETASGTWIRQLTIDSAAR